MKTILKTLSNRIEQLESSELDFKTRLGIALNHRDILVSKKWKIKDKVADIRGILFKSIEELNWEQKKLELLSITKAIQELLV